MVTRNEAGNANGTSFKEKGNSHRKLDSRPTLKRWFGSRACPDSLETKSNRFRVRDCRLEISSASQTSGGSLLIASAAASALDQNDFPELLDVPSSLIRSFILLIICPLFPSSGTGNLIPLVRMMYQPFQTLCSLFNRLVGPRSNSS